MMLQQTRVDQAIPYFERFMRRFPTVQRLAAADRQEVLKLWEGLGYYARARRIHETARLLCERRKGRFPSTVEELLDLPGIGPYSAAAIASLAFGRDAAVVDGNVIRVLARWMGYDGDTRRSGARSQFQSWATDLLVPGAAGEFNEAMMELGATRCLPRRPVCARCPMKAVCRAFSEGDPEAYPRKPPARRLPHKVVGAGVVMDARGRLLIAQRKDEAMLGGLWEFPGGSRESGETLPQCIARELREELDIDVAVGDALTVVHHAYSHFTIELHAYWARIRRGRPKAIHCAAFAWVTREDLRQYPFSRADLHIIEAIRSARRPSFPMIGK